MVDNRGCLVAAMPLYEKTHSWGEFVFDWSWANAYERAGLSYYPKLVSSAPFTPAPSRRLLTRTPDHGVELLRAAREYADDSGLSSLHVLFPEEDELAVLRDAGLKLRKDCQFHWHNRGYASFDDFLATFSSSKRKKARRERRRVAEQGISFRRLRGADMDVAIWADVFELISTTFLRRGSLPYYSLEFFEEVSRRLPDSLLIHPLPRRIACRSRRLFSMTPPTRFTAATGAPMRITMRCTSRPATTRESTTASNTVAVVSSPAPRANTRSAAVLRRSRPGPRTGWHGPNSSPRWASFWKPRNVTSTATSTR